MVHHYNIIFNVNVISVNIININNTKTFFKLLIMFRMANNGN